jgi:hypothetical protein
MASEGRDGRALALSLLVVVEHRPNRAMGVTVLLYGKFRRAQIDFLMLLPEEHDYL